MLKSLILFSCFIVVNLFAVNAFSLSEYNDLGSDNYADCKVDKKAPRIMITDKVGKYFCEYSRLKYSGQKAIDNLNKIFGLDNDYVFMKLSEKNDGLGFTHLKYNVFYKDIPLEWADVLVHIKDGKLDSINGGWLTPVNRVKSARRLSPDDAFDVVKKYLNVDSLDPLEKEINGKMVKVDKQYESSLVYDNYPGTEPRLAYKITTNEFDYYIDTITGKILRHIAIVKS